MADSHDHHWLNTFTDAPALRTLCDRLAERGHVLAEGASGSSTTLLAGALAARRGRPVLLVVAHLDDADDAVEDLALFGAAGHPVTARRFGALEVMPGESNISVELLAERLAVVESLAAFDSATNPSGATDSAADASASAKPSVPDASTAQRTDDSGRFAPSAVRGTHQASDSAPNRQSPIRNPQLLVAPIAALMQSVPQPDALADFTLTLRVGAKLPPAQLLDWLDRAGYQRTDAVEQPGDYATRGGIIDVFAPSTGGDDCPVAGPAAVRIDYFGDDIDSLCLIDVDTLGSADRLERFQLIGASADKLQSDERTTNLVSLLAADTIVVLAESMELAEQARGYYERLIDPRGIYAPQAMFKLLTARPHVQVDAYGGAGRGDADTVKLPVSALAAFEHDAAEAVAELAALSQRSRVVVLCQKPAERDRLIELIQEHAPNVLSKVGVEVGYLHRGFVWSDSSNLKPQVSSLTLIPHHELFHRYHTRRRIRRVSASADQATDAFFDLDAGDHVVHVDHGIARFTGLRAMKRQGKTEDYLTLEFAGAAKLHVPATQTQLVQKYVGGFHGRPPLSKLGGTRWTKQKEKTREAVQDLAGEMLRIQAARASLPGVRYPADTAWQHEFEAEFPYDETDDQLAAIAALKKDMAHEQPMDRLICGDVGFGKTEVAIRAAFKAAEYGKQVAVLVPTTVLAEQHERTFGERMADYPFRVESISRFKTARQQNELIKELKQGRIDVIIGTHRLLSKDVKFADLGLVVIDEEQRFGVEHKQKLLQFRMTADVLTLTATPIPRTLHMSMLGLRDISSLSTPPVDRRAIVTEVIPYDEQRIKHAIVRELNRDGQVFFVHNRVHNIESVAADVRRLVPDARVIVGHGQMPGHELEEVMLAFIRRQADVLVCTTIIESGIDIPTANTMLINNADNFGLADLHQLRGRVGRYKHRAYCYLMLPAERPITEKATRRLKAIEQYSMLGAGFKIAMRDLEIRGAGNLLGPEQSGHIAAVGYQMYCHLLEQEAKKLRQEKIIEPVKTHIELPVVGRLPARYIASQKHRMDMYRRLSRAASLDELDRVVRDMTDAYGQPPEPVQTLIDITELRIATSTLGVESMKLDGPDIIFHTRDPQRLSAVMADAPGRVTLLDQRTVYFRPPGNYLTATSTMMAVLRKLLVRPVRGQVEAAAAVG